MNFPGIEFLETESKYKSRKKTWSFCVYHLHKRPRDGISRRGRAVTAKKWTKKLAARSKLFFAYQNYFFAVIVAVNVIVAYFESSLILTVHGKWKRGPARANDEAKKKNPFYLALPKMLRFNLKTVFFVVIQH